MQRHRFGRRAETLSEDRLLLGFEEVEQTAASDEARQETTSPAEREARATKRQANRGSLPSRLPRIETVVDIEDHRCPCCRGALHVIGEDRAERLDIVPAQFRVLVIRPPKYACRVCKDVVVQAPAPPRLIEGGIPTEATVAQVVAISVFILVRTSVFVPVVTPCRVELIRRAAEERPNYPRRAEHPGRLGATNGFAFCRAQVIRQDPGRLAERRYAAAGDKFATVANLSP